MMFKCTLMKEQINFLKIKSNQINRYLQHGLRVKLINKDFETSFEMAKSLKNNEHYTDFVMIQADIESNF